MGSETVDVYSTYLNSNPERKRSNDANRKTAFIRIMQMMYLDSRTQLLNNLLTDADILKMMKTQKLTYMTNDVKGIEGTSYIAKSDVSFSDIDALRTLSDDSFSVSIRNPYNVGNGLLIPRMYENFAIPEYGDWTPFTTEGYMDKMKGTPSTIVVENTTGDLYDGSYELTTTTDDFLVFNKMECVPQHYLKQQDGTLNPVTSPCVIFDFKLNRYELRLQKVTPNRDFVDGNEVLTEWTILNHKDKSVFYKPSTSEFLKLPVIYAYYAINWTKRRIQNLKIEQDKLNFITGGMERIKKQNEINRRTEELDDPELQFEIVTKSANRSIFSDEKFAFTSSDGITTQFKSTMSQFLVEIRDGTWNSENESLFNTITIDNGKPGDGEYNPLITGVLIEDVITSIDQLKYRGFTETSSKSPGLWGITTDGSTNGDYIFHTFTSRSPYMVSASSWDGDYYHTIRMNEFTISEDFLNEPFCIPFRTWIKLIACNPILEKEGINIFGEYLEEMRNTLGYKTENGKCSKNCSTLLQDMCNINNDENNGSSFGDDLATIRDRIVYAINERNDQISDEYNDMCSCFDVVKIQQQIQNKIDADQGGVIAKFLKLFRNKGNPTCINKACRESKFKPHTDDCPPIGDIAVVACTTIFKGDVQNQGNANNCQQDIVNSTTNTDSNSDATSDDFPDKENEGVTDSGPAEQSVGTSDSGPVEQSVATSDSGPVEESAATSDSKETSDGEAESISVLAIVLIVLSVIIVLAIAIAIAVKLYKKKRNSEKKKKLKVEMVNDDQ